MDERWIQEMREKMADYKWPAPELSWVELDQALAAGVTHRAHLIWLRRMAAAAVILLIAGVGYWGLLHKETETVVGKHWAQKQPISQGDVSISHGDRNDVTSQTSHVFFDKRNGRAERLSPCEITVPVAEIDTLNTTETTEKAQPQVVEEKAKPTQEILPVVYPSELPQKQHVDNRLMAKVYMSSTMAGNQTGSYDMQEMYTASLGVDQGYGNLKTHTEQYVHHRQPVRFGLSLRYRLTDRWSVESGLTYTRLSSDITTIVDDEMTVTEQRLNYLGLPLNISYELWRSRYFGLYVTGGGTIEKCLDASLWQFSLNGAAGAEYKLTDFFSLYAEPGIGYYFKDGSSTPTIYKDHPLNFNLSFGLRLNIK